MVVQMRGRVVYGELVFVCDGGSVGRGRAAQTLACRNAQALSK